jgi:cystathionine beta-synthase
MKKNFSNSILECIGDTPLARLNHKKFTCPVYAKLEMLNPGGSFKDRMGLYMIQEAEKKGLLKPGGTIIEASSGNQGATLAMIGAAKGYKVIITASTKISEEKLRVLKACGAKVNFFSPTKNLEDSNSYYSQAKKLASLIPNSYWPNQYHNPTNPEAHYKITGPEIWRQTKGRITHFFAAAGSTGTIMGVGKYLKKKNPKIKIIGVDMANSFYSNKHPKPYKTEGIGIDYSPKFFNKKYVDEFITATDKQTFTNCKKLAKTTGILAGGSSGAVMHALLVYANKFKKTDFVVALFADSGRSYLSKIF